MKKSRIAKLALMGASVTALAATLTTSTYAWYVSNKTAKVNEVTGSTAEGASDGSISLSTDGVASHYYKSISLTAAANYNGVSSSVKLEPVSTTNGTTFVIPTYNTQQSQYTTADGSGSVYYFMFYIKAAKGCTVTPNVKITNTTTVVPTQVNYSAAGNVGGVADGLTFTVDAINALHMSLVKTPGTAYSSTQTTYSAGTADTTQIQKVVGGNYVTNVLSEDIDAYANKATGGAAAYYNEIMGVQPYTSAVAYSTSGQGATGEAFNTISLAANTPVKLEYRIWLDGGDAQCFNACASQNFKFDFTYTITGA